MNTSNNAEYQRIVVLDTETTGMNREGGPHYEGIELLRSVQLKLSTVNSPDGIFTST